MSAAATAPRMTPQRGRRSKAIPLPYELRDEKFLLPSERGEKFFQFSPKFQNAKRKKCPGGRIEVLLLDWVWEQACISQTAWVQLHIPTLAEEMVVTSDGIERALKKLATEDRDGDPVGLVELRRVGKLLYARVREESFDEVEEREPAVLDKDPEIAQQALVAVPAVAYRYLPTGTSHRYEEHRVEVFNDSGRIGIREETIDGLLQIHIASETLDVSNTCAETITQVRHSELSEESSMRELLTRWMPWLDSPENLVIKAAIEARGEVPYSILAQTLHAHKSRIKKSTKPWDFVINLIRRAVGRHSQIQRSTGKRSARSAPKAPARPAGSSEERYAKFMEASVRCGLPASRVDHSAAEILFDELSIEEQIAAINGLNERLEAGEFEDERFRPRPDNYLKKRMWERPVRRKLLSREEQLNEEVKKLHAEGLR